MLGRRLLECELGHGLGAGAIAPHYLVEYLHKSVDGGSSLIYSVVLLLVLRIRTTHTRTSRWPSIV